MGNLQTLCVEFAEAVFPEPLPPNSQGITPTRQAAPSQHQGGTTSGETEGTTDTKPLLPLPKEEETYPPPPIRIPKINANGDVVCPSAPQPASKPKIYLNVRMKSNQSQIHRRPASIAFA